MYWGKGGVDCRGVEGGKDGEFLNCRGKIDPVYPQGLREKGGGSTPLQQGIEQFYQRLRPRVLTRAVVIHF